MAAYFTEFKMKCPFQIYYSGPDFIFAILQLNVDVSLGPIQTAQSHDGQQERNLDASISPLENRTTGSVNASLDSCKLLLLVLPGT